MTDFLNAIEALPYAEKAHIACPRLEMGARLEVRKTVVQALPFANSRSTCALLQVRRGIRRVAPASTVRIVPVMPLALVREDRNT
jgi:hypothetical protein